MSDQKAVDERVAVLLRGTAERERDEAWLYSEEGPDTDPDKQQLRLDAAAKLERMATVMGRRADG